MTPVAWIVAVAGAGWLLLTVGLGGGANPEAFWGMLGPLTGALASWIAYSRAHGSAPELLTRVMIAGVALKLVFFSAYVAVMVRVFELRPQPFVVSLASGFIALHAIEAYFLRRMVMDGLRRPRRERTERLRSV